MTYSLAVAADKVVAILMGGTVGNDAASDVVNGKTFSSKAAGKGEMHVFVGCTLPLESEFLSPMEEIQ